MSTGTGTGAAQQQPSPQDPPRPGKTWKLTLAGLVTAFVVLAGYDLISNSSELGLSAATAVASPSRTAMPTVNTASAVPRSAATGGPAPAPTASTAIRPASRPLGVVSIAAFGPDGTPDGDNPGIASRILDVSTEQPWYSQWYTTPGFGNLKAGTGLLLSMGRQVTVSSVRLVLGSQVGAAMQVRVGDTPALAGMSTVAAATDVGGAVRLSAATRASGRYVLIWFTALPPNGQGEYQVSVYHATVDGTAVP